MSFFGDILTSLFDRAPMLRGAVPDDNKPIEVLCRDVLSSRGDVSGMSLAKLVLDRYVHFDIYGWNGTAQPARHKGGALQGPRALVKALDAWLGSHGQA